MPWQPVVAVVCATVLVAGGLLLWRRRWKRRIRERFAEYRERVAQLSQTLDALKERHKLLPYTDADFATPMTGQTATLYQAAQEALERHRRCWLDLMNAWEKAETLLAEESWWGAAKHREADQLLAAAGLKQAIDAVQRDCAAPLDRLEQAHEEAAAQMAAAEQRTPRLAARLSDVEKVGLPVDPYRPELTAISNLVNQARTPLQSDPIAALELLQQASQRAEQWEQWIATILQLRQQAEEALQKLEEASSAMNRRRNEGFRFCEPDADPRALLDEGWRQRQTALGALERGETSAAAEAVAAAFRAADDANGAVNRTVEAKQSCAAACALRADDRRRLEGAVRQGQRQREELERDFAADSWREVREHVERARSLLDRTEAAMDEAASLASPEAQHYLRAATVVERARGQRAEAEALLTAVARRLEDLVAMRRKRRDELSELRRRVDRLAESLQRSGADRVRSNERCREAVRLVGEAADLAERPRADWRRIEEMVEEIGKLTTEAERLAQEDFQLARQAADEIEDARRECQTARGFRRLGIGADTASAERLVDEAQRQLDAQDYEAAIRLAARAEQEARQALAEAQRRASQQEAELDEQRRREAAVAKVAGSGEDRIAG